jgi:hypothetical protein
MIIECQVKKFFFSRLRFCLSYNLQIIYSIDSEYGLSISKKTLKGRCSKIVQKSPPHSLDKYPGENKGREGLRTGIPRNLKWLEKNETI